MAYELRIRDISRSYVVRGLPGPAAVPGADGEDRRVAAHALLARVLACISAASSAGGDAAARDVAMGRMPCTRLCFSTQKLPVSKFAELDRQLAGQQQGLNALTVQEYLQARARFDPRARDPQVARRARASWRETLRAARREALQRQGADLGDLDRQACEYADRRMRGLHALHTPDRVAGGRDVIGDFGDGQVNSTIGRQWTLARRGGISRVQQLDSAASGVPEAIRARTHMNGMLTRDAGSMAPRAAGTEPIPPPSDTSGSGHR